MNDIALSNQIPLALLSAYGLQWLKGSRFFPWITAETQTLNRWAGAVVAFCASVGVLVSFDHATGVLTISGLTAVNLGHVAWRFAQQWLLQQAAYKGVVAQAGKQ